MNKSQSQIRFEDQQRLLAEQEQELREREVRKLVAQHRQAADLAQIQQEQGLLKVKVDGFDDSLEQNIADLELLLEAQQLEEEEDQNVLSAQSATPVPKAPVGLRMPAPLMISSPLVSMPGYSVSSNASYNMNNQFQSPQRMPLGLNVPSRFNSFVLGNSNHQQVQSIVANSQPPPPPKKQPLRYSTSQSKFLPADRTDVRSVERKNYTSDGKQQQQQDEQRLQQARPLKAKRDHDRDADRSDDTPEEQHQLFIPNDVVVDNEEEDEDVDDQEEEQDGGLNFSFSMQDEQGRMLDQNSIIVDPQSGQLSRLTTGQDQDEDEDEESDSDDEDLPDEEKALRKAQKQMPKDKKEARKQKMFEAKKFLKTTEYIAQVRKFAQKTLLAGREEAELERVEYDINGRPIVNQGPRYPERRSKLIKRDFVAKNKRAAAAAASQSSTSLVHAASANTGNFAY